MLVSYSYLSPKKPPKNKQLLYLFGFMNEDGKHSQSVTVGIRSFFTACFKCY